MLLPFFIIVFNLSVSFFFFFTAPSTAEIYTLSLHDALPILPTGVASRWRSSRWPGPSPTRPYRWRSSERGGRRSSTERSPLRSEEHTSELQSHHDLVCRLLLEKKKKE